MATKPPSKSAPAPTGTAVAKRATNSVVNIQELLKKQAAEMGDRVAPASGISISIKNSEFRFPDGRKTTDPIKLVIVDFVAANSFYEGTFDPNNMTSPVCFAVGPNPMKMDPVSDSPVQQSTSCTGCPMNEFGSAGKGKACKNTRLLAVLPPDANDQTPLSKLSVPPTSVKNWDTFVRQVTSMFQMPPVSVVATVSFGDTDYPTLIFSDPEPNENLAVHFKRQEEAREMLMAKPDFSQGAKPAKKVANGARRR